MKHVVSKSCPTLCSLWLHGLQHARLPCLSPSPGVCSNSCPSHQWCHLTISPGKNTGVGNHSFLQGVFWLRDQTCISRIAGRFFTIWATREALSEATLPKQINKKMNQTLFLWFPRTETVIFSLFPGLVDPFQPKWPSPVITIIQLVTKPEKDR